MDNNEREQFFDLFEDIRDDLHRIAYNLEVIANSDMYRTPRPDVLGFGLLSSHDYTRFYSRIPHYSDFWWLDAKEKMPKEAPIVTKEGIVEKVSVSVKWGKIRPVITVANGSEFGYKQVVRVGMYYFTYIGGDCLICNTCLPDEDINYLTVLNWTQDEWEQHLFGYDDDDN